MTMTLVCITTYWPSSVYFDLIFLELVRELYQPTTKAQSILSAICSLIQTNKESDSKLMSVFMCPINRDPDNNLELLCAFWLCQNCSWMQWPHRPPCFMVSWPVIVQFYYCIRALTECRDRVVRVPKEEPWLNIRPKIQQLFSIFLCSY
jgi:hypothetical protein